ncbi:MAG: hypothetical protein QHH24_00225 [Candidatus Bathyarchaeota archaeon]|nr:hypothetical protein [Candidatus Bathyarchaeota archaeon]
MSWRELVYALLVVVGIVLFLYGANYYDAIVGWVGVGMIFAGVVAEVVEKIYEFVSKRKGAQKP